MLTQAKGHRASLLLGLNKEANLVKSIIMRKYLLLTLTLLNSFILFATQATGKLASQASADVIKLHGRLTSATLSGDMQSGIYSFEVSEKWNLSPVVKDATFKKSGCDVYADGKYYSYTWTQSSWQYDTKFVVRDATDNWKIKKEVAMGNLPSAQVPSYLFYNPADGKIYGYAHMSTKWYEIDTETGKYTEVASDIKADGTTKYFNSVAADANGIIYATETESGKLYTIDLKKKEAKFVGETKRGSTQPLSSTIDKKSGRMFLFLMPSFGSTTEILEINKSTGEVVKSIQCPKGEIFQHIFIKEEKSETDSKMPDTPTSVNVTYTTPGQLAATLKATAPTKAYDKTTALQGNVTIDFLVNDQKVGEATNVAPGEEGTYSYTFEKEGIYWVKAIAKNEHGSSPAAQASTYAGFDTPLPVTNAKLEIKEDGTYTLTWEAPAKGIYNGEINKNNLTYKIVRYPAKQVETEAAKGTTHTGKIAGKEMQDYYFGIIAMDGEKKSEEAFSNHVSYGEGIRLPFVEGFDNSNNWGLYKVIDENHDGTWELDAASSRLRVNSCKNQHKDYFFLPATKMRKGVTYTLQFTAQSGFNTQCYVNVYMMDSQSIPEDQDFEQTFKPLMKLKVENDTEPAVYTVTYTAEEDGIKYFMLYDFSNPNSILNIEELSISASKVDDAPAEVENMSVTADATGKLEATIKFNAPTKLGNGQALSSITAIEIYKGMDHKAIKRFENPEPGKEYTYVDNTAWQGKNEYRVVCFNENGNNAGVKQEIWVGEDIADAAGDAKAAYDKKTDKALITWTAPTKGYHGGYINLEKLTYTIQLGISGWSIGDDFITIKGGVTETKFELDVASYRQFFPKSGNALISIIIIPVTSYGEGVPAYAKFYVGDAYPLPFSDSFAAGDFTTAPWGVSVIGEGAVAWGKVKGNAPEGLPLAGVAPQDNDMGMLVYYQEKYEVCENRATGPMIDITGAKDPVATFYLFHRTANKENNYFFLEGVAEDGTFHELSDKIYIGEGTGWQKHVVHLNEKNKAGITTFRIALHAKATANTDFYFDNLQITDGEIENQFPAVTDLQGSLSEDGKYVNLSWSTPDAGDFSLVGYQVYCDGNKLGKYTSDNTYRAEFDGKAHTYQVQVIYNEGDSNLSNEVTITPGSGIDSQCAEGIRVFTNGNEVHMEGANTEYHIYSATGAEVGNGVIEGEEIVTLSKGIYFIRTGNQVTKCIIY